MSNWYDEVEAQPIPNKAVVGTLKEVSAPQTNDWGTSTTLTFSILGGGEEKLFFNINPRFFTDRDNLEGRDAKDFVKLIRSEAGSSQPSVLEALTYESGGIGSFAGSFDVGESDEELIENFVSALRGLVGNHIGLNITQRRQKEEDPETGETVYLRTARTGVDFFRPVFVLDEDTVRRLERRDEKQEDSDEPRTFVLGWERGALEL